MFTITQSDSAVAAKKYFNNGLSREDYYAGTKGSNEEPHEPSLWAGKAAEQMGLSGEVTRAAFHKLCDNELPDGSGKLTPRTKAKRRVGYDFTFLIPKSICILFAITLDRRIIDLFRLAVQLTMKIIEAEAQTRVRQGGANANRVTGNLIWAEFIHTTTRPIGGLPDPLLHAHCFVFNSTYDAVEKRWKAVELGDIKAKASYYEAVFHSIYSHLLTQAGFVLRHEGRFYEVEGIERPTIEKYSHRTIEIEREVAKRGITDPKEKAEVGAKTRRSKSESCPWSEITAEWNRRLTNDERAAILAAGKGQVPPPPEHAARDAVHAAIAKCFQTSATVEEHRIVEEALRLSFGKATIENIRAELGKADLATCDVGGSRQFVSKETRADEQRVIEFARDGRGACPPLVRDSATGDAASLNAFERFAETHVLSSRDRVTLVRSRDNRSRDEVTRASVSALRAVGLSVAVITAGKAASPGTASLTEFLANPKPTVSAVLWIDDASRLTLSALTKLVGVAKQCGARLVLSGSIGTGMSKRPDLLRTLEEKAGLRSAAIEQSRSKKAERQKTVESLRNGKPHDGFRRLVSSGRVQEGPKEQLAHTVANEYAKNVRRGKSAWVVTDFDLPGFVAAIRFALRRMLGLSRPFYQLKPVRMADRSDPREYKRGQVVSFYKSVKGFKAGHRYKIIGHDAFGNVLAREIRFVRPLRIERRAWVEALPLSKTKHFSVCEESRIELARGDRIQITSGGRTLNETFGIEKLLSKRGRAIRSANFKMFGIKIPDRRYKVPRDTVATVKGFTIKGNIKLDNGWVLSKKFGHFDYAYASADPPPKGRGIDDLLIVQGAEKADSDFASRCFRRNGPKVTSVTVFTDNVDRTKQAMGGEPGEPKRSRYVTPEFAHEHAGVQRQRQEVSLER